MTIADLVEDPRNPRSITEAAADGLGASMEELGDLSGITWNRTTGELVAGHKRVEQLRKAGATTIEEDTAGPFLRHPKSGEVFRIRVVEWDRDRQLLGNLAANNPAIQGEFTTDVETLLAEAQESFPDLYDEMRLGEILAEVEEVPDADATDEAKDAEPQVDRAAELAKTWGTKRGQIWEIPSKTTPGKNHRVMCGDCRESVDVDVLMAGQKVNVAFTSPPYASQRKYDEESGFKPIKPEVYVDWFDAVQANVRAHLAMDGSWFVNIKEHCEDGQRHLYVKDLTITHVRAWGWELVDELVWLRKGVPGGWPNRFKNGWEPVFHFAGQSEIRFNPLAVGHESDAAFEYDATMMKTPAGFLSGKKNGEGKSKEDIIKSGIARPSNVIEVQTGDVTASGVHSATFPAGLPSFFIKAYSDPGDLIFDPFLGSGTTLVAAENESRLCVGMEISPKYVAVILQRATDIGLTPHLVTEPSDG